MKAGISAKALVFMSMPRSLNGKIITGALQISSSDPAFSPLIAINDI